MSAANVAQKSSKTAANNKAKIANTQKASSVTGISAKSGIKYSISKEPGSEDFMVMASNAKELVGTVTIADMCNLEGKNQTVTGIGKFKSQGLVNINLPSSIEYIQSDAFFECPKLKSINFTNGSETFASIDGVLYELRQNISNTNFEYVDEKSDPDDDNIEDQTTMDYAYGEHYVVFFCPRGYVGSLEIPENINGIPVQAIAPKAFKDCKGLTSVKLASGIKEISSQSFKNCTKLKSVTGKEVNAIGMAAFKNCQVLDNIEFANANKDLRIDKKAFENCNSIKVVDLSKANSIDMKSNSFAGCKNIETINLGNGAIRKDSVTKTLFTDLPKLKYAQGNFEGSDFVKCPNLVALGVEGKSAKLKYIGTEVKTLELPEYIMCSGWKYYVDGTSGNEGNKLSKNVFDGQKKLSKLTTVTLPKTIKVIDNGIFAGLPLLKTANISNSTEVSSGAFDSKVEIKRYGPETPYNSIANADSRYAMKKIVNSTNDTTVAKVKMEPWNGNQNKLAVNCDCEKTGEIGINLDLTNFRKEGKQIYAITGLKNCHNLQSLTLPTSVKIISDNAFEGCNELKEIKIDMDNEVYAAHRGGIYKKDRNDKLTLIDILPTKKEITIPDSINGMEVVGIETEAIGNKDLSILKIGANIKEIKDSAFFGNKKLTKVIIYKPLERIGNSAFENCNVLTNINLVGEHMTIGNKAFHNCHELTTIQMPDSANSIAIGNEAFKGCVKVKRLDMHNIENSTIGKEAFGSCTSLRKILLANESNEIGDMAFANCTELNTVYLPGESSKIHIGESAFDNCVKLKYFDAQNTNNLVLNKYAFNHCKTMNKIKLPNKYVAKETPCFNDCAIEFYLSAEGSGENLFENCEKLVLYELYDNEYGSKSLRISKIGKEVENLNVPDSLKHNETWYKVDDILPQNNAENLKSIKLPMYLRLLDKGVLKECTNLQTVKVHLFTKLASKSYYQKAKMTRYGAPEEKREIKKEFKAMSKRQKATEKSNNAVALND